MPIEYDALIISDRLLFRWPAVHQHQRESLAARRKSNQLFLSQTGISFSYVTRSAEWRVSGVGLVT